MELERLEAATPLQAEADVIQASPEGRKEYDTTGNESDNVETTCCKQGSGRCESAGSIDHTVLSRRNGGT